MIQVEVLKKLKVVFCSFLLIVHTSVLGVKYFPCNCGSFKACNPAPSHYHGNLDWKLDVKKKVWRSRRNHSSPTSFHLCVYSFTLGGFRLRLCVKPGCPPDCFPGWDFSDLFFSSAGIQREGGKRSGCLKVCGRHVVHRWDWVCSEIRALKCDLSTSLQNDWQSVHIWFTSETLEIGKESQRRKSSNGVVLVVIGEGGFGGQKV